MITALASNNFSVEGEDAELAAIIALSFQLYPPILCHITHGLLNILSIVQTLILWLGCDDV